MPESAFWIVRLVLPLLTKVLDKVISRARTPAKQRQSGLLVSSVIRTLLSVQPDIDKAAHELDQAARLWPANPDLRKAKRLLDKAIRDSEPPKPWELQVLGGGPSIQRWLKLAARDKGGRKKATRKRAVRKKAARKKAARKKAARKKAVRKRAVRNKATRKQAVRK